jgi:hypothetical protein
MVQNLLSVTVHLPEWIQQGCTKGGGGGAGWAAEEEHWNELVS